MSKHLGNILEPIPLMDEHGADAVRWFMAASGSPWAARRVGHATIQETVRKVLLTYWNTVAFQVLYARTAGWSPGDAGARARPTARCSTGGRSRRRTGSCSAVTEALEDFDTQRAGALLAAYVDDLSNWYVRRSRRRFWDGDPAALATLHECLYVVTLLMAPITPFITERVWQDLVRGRRRRSCPSRSTSRPGRRSTAAWSTTSCRPADVAGPPARRARPRRPGRGQGADPAAAAPRAGRARRRYDRLSEELRARGRRGAQRRRGRAAVVRRRRPGRPRGQGQLPGAGQAVRASRRRGSPPAIAAADAAALAAALAGRRPGDGERRRRGRRGAARRGDRLRAAARGLVGGQRAGRDRRARPGAHPGAACAPAWPARWSGWSRRPARPAASRSPTGSP